LSFVKETKLIIFATSVNQYDNVRATSENTRNLDKGTENTRKCNIKDKYYGIIRKSMNLDVFKP
jgi:hypothetical protein